MWITLLSWGSKFLPILKLRKVWLSVASVAALGLLYLYVGHLQGKIEDLQADNKLFVRYLNECQLANVENQRTVGDLESANRYLASVVKVSNEEREAAIIAAAARELEAKLKLDDTLDTLQDLQNESLSCNELMEVELGAVCPLTDQRLRDHAANPISQD